MAELYRSYSSAALSYGPNPDDLAGDEYYHHPARKIIGHWLTDKGDQPDPRLNWAAGDVPFSEQVKGFQSRLKAGMDTWAEWLSRCDGVMAKLGPEDVKRASDQLRFHGIIHLTGCKGFYLLCRSYEAYREGRYPQAFVYASESLWNYRQSLDALRQAEHGKWERFFKADWLTNVEQTIENVDTLRRYLRMHGDSPDFFLWYKEYLMPVTEKYIYLENTHRNPLSDDRLAELLKDHFEEIGML